MTAVTRPQNQTIRLKYTGVDDWSGSGVDADIVAATGTTGKIPSLNGFTAEVGHFGI